MKIERLTVGMLQEHTYFVIDEKSKTTFIIDPGAEASRLLKKVKEEGLKVQAILLTHAHFDHIGAAPELREALKCEIITHEESKIYLSNANYNLSGVFGDMPFTFEADRYIKEGDLLHLNESDITFKVLFAPGHTLDGIAYYSEEQGVAFVGDIIFKGSIGRCDHPGGDMQTLLRSIPQQIFTLPEKTILYAGHGEATTVGKEKSTNPFFNIFD